MGIFSELKNKYSGRRLYVVGHEGADFDSLASAYLVSRWLSRLGMDSVPVLPDTADAPDAIPRKVMLLHGVDTDKWLRATTLDVAGGAVILVDCHVSCIEGEVVAVIDHHPTAEPLPATQELCFNMTASSCALAAYRLALADGVAVTDDEEILVVRSVYMAFVGKVRSRRQAIASGYDKKALDRRGRPSPPRALLCRPFASGSRACRRRVEILHTCGQKVRFKPYPGGKYSQGAYKRRD